VISRKMKFGSAGQHKCETCRFYESYGEDLRVNTWATAYCQRINVKPDTPVLAYTDDGSLCVTPDFGCVLWEVKVND
jgi:hypothetical protein